MFIPYAVPSISLLPLPDSGSDGYITDRARLIGGGPVEYSCAANIDFAMVRWFHNGELIESSGGGVVISNENLTIADPQVQHSGIYQCSVTDFNLADEQIRSWVLEVRDPSELKACK